MNIKRIIQTASVTGAGLFLMAASASAGTITFTTNSPATAFNNTGAKSISSASGAAATLSFTDNGSVTVGSASNVNYGNFTLACATCGTQASGNGANFASFFFDLVIVDSTDNAQGHFHGAANAGTVFSDASPLTISWTPASPATLGAGGQAADFGNFKTTAFTVYSPAAIVSPNTGTIGVDRGVTTVQGFVSSQTFATPEPATFAMFGGALLGLGLLRRKSVNR